MNILFKVHTSFVKLFLVEFFALAVGYGIISSLKNVNVFFLLICAILILFFCYFIAGKMYQVVLLYEDKIVIAKPLLNSVTSIAYNEIRHVTITHVYQEGPQVIIEFKHPHNGMINTQFDYLKKQHENLLQIFKDMGVNISNDFK
jgi:hypothetical protein